LTVTTHFHRCNTKTGPVQTMTSLVEPTNKAKKKRARSSPASGGGVSSSVFSAVEALEAQDADTERQRQSGATKSQDMQRRSAAAISQTEIGTSLLECRILLQRSVQAPQQLFKKAKLDTVELDNVALGQSLDKSRKVLIQLLRARQMMSVQKQTGDAVVDYRDIVQSDDALLEEQLQTEYDLHRNSWKEVLNRRHKDVRLHSGALTNKTQFRVVDSSFWHQVESTAQHEQLREASASRDVQSDDQIPAFDDTKIYQNMLKDFLTESAATGGAGGMAAQSAAAAAQQRLLGRSSSKQSQKSQVDRKASKGRKIRYTDIPKLANFTFPLSRPQGSATTSADTLVGLDEDAWFRSLFGGSEWMNQA
jgi:Apoptosis-antagonizing transcription factor, C-terminal